MRARRVLVAFALLAPSVVLAASPVAAADPPNCFIPATIYGVSGTIVGTNGNDVIVGSPGNDIIYAGGGDDLVCGGGGDDIIDGGAGTDLLYGEDGADQVSGGQGNDLLTGESRESNGLLPVCGDGAADQIDGGSGDDLIMDPCGANRATGGDGQDTGAVTGTFDGGNGDDNQQTVPLHSTLLPNVHFQLVFDPAVFARESCPGCGDGRATGGNGDDWVGVLGGVADGGQGDDWVIGNAPGDVALGGLGADRVSDFSRVGGLLLDGGSGRDTCELSGPTPDTVLNCETVS